MAANTVSVDFSIPEGIVRPPMCLVALTGLDTRNNAVHMAIWDLFKAARRGERKSVKYVGVNADHLYPKRKQVSSCNKSLKPIVQAFLTNNYLIPSSVLHLAMRFNTVSVCIIIRSNQ